MGFKDRIAQYNASKEPKVNPPEASAVMEQTTAPEVAGKPPEPTQTASSSAAPPSAPVENSAAPPAAVSDAPSAAPKTRARRARAATSGAAPAAEGSVSLPSVTFEADNAALLPLIPTRAIYNALLDAGVTQGSITITIG